MSYAREHSGRRPVLTGSLRPRAPWWATPVLWLAMVTMGLMAGLFYAFSVSVMPGLARTDDRTFVFAMQRINQVIENPVFFGTFFGALVFTGAAAFVQYRMGLRDAMWWTVAALALYIVALAITMGVNVPLNNKLAAAGKVDHIHDLAAVRDAFEGVWVTTNGVRALACTLALACLGRSLSLQGKGEVA
ncbi:anthrone oxygenase family protein [Sphaerisporangium fuscum]|uniref:anthrone oxygenase family protein n=1 Tax=Sphaerisporangium fuscum TaxID=2835868 RepID=UPI002029A159|nr:anthrone oxygenase family protein [Sphaerisporangium fuscum]